MFKFVNKLYKDQKISFKVDRKKPVKILGFSVQTSKTKIPFGASKFLIPFIKSFISFTCANTLFAVIISARPYFF